MIMFQRFADARTALASGDLDITAFGPQDISLTLGPDASSRLAGGPVYGESSKHWLVPGDPQSP
jgi:hypothetical protein